MPRIAVTVPAAVATLALASFTLAAPNDWAEGVEGHDDGATRDYYNRAGLLAWEHKLGDWRDARGEGQGDAAYATAVVTSQDRGRFVAWDVTPLVREWHAGTHPNQGFFLRLVEGRGDFQFASREEADAARRPQLVLTGGGGPVTLTPVADTYLEASTYRSQGHLGVLRVSNRPNHALLRFDLPAGGPPDKATLRLFSVGQTSGAKGTLGVFRCRQGHADADADVVRGLADKYPDDRGIGSDPDVLFFTDFEADDWRREWSEVGSRANSATVAADAARQFAPWQGKALRANMAKGENTALNTLFRFRDKGGAEPEEMYFRYYLRLGDDWDQTVSGGKLPGFSGTYGKAGWGGRKSTGANGWSARGWFARTVPAGNPLAGLTPVGTYCYHADQPGTYGDTWVWQRGYRGFLAKNRWYCVEQQVKLNKVGAADGELRAWVDGRPAFEKTDLRFRTVERLKIEQLWLNVYHGGTQPSPRDQHVFLDNVVIARRYIGPVR